MITLTIEPIPSNAACGVHESTDWQVATDSSFTNIIHESLNDTINLTSISFNDNQYYDFLYGRAKPNTTICNFNWSIVPLNQINNHPVINRPTVTLTRSYENQYINSSSFVSSDSNSVHASTIWEIKDEFNNVIFSTEVSSGDLLKVMIPVGIMMDNNDYCFLAKHKDTNGFVSSFGALLARIKEQPVIITITPSEINTPNSTTMSTGSFHVVQGTDTHKFTNWWIKEQQGGAIVFQSLNDTVNLTSITFPSNTMTPGEWYILQVQFGGHKGLSGIYSTSHHAF